MKSIQTWKLGLMKIVSNHCVMMNHARKIGARSVHSLNTAINKIFAI
jgi:hypothetical protein